MRKTICFLALAIVATPAAAAVDWRSVGTNTSGSKYWIDASTMTRDGDTVTVWVKTEYGTPGPNGTTNYKARREIRCRTKSYRDLQTVYYRGADVNSTSGVEETSTAAPESMAEAVVDKACAL
jgi:hypothetical protein